MGFLSLSSRCSSWRNVWQQEARRNGCIHRLSPMVRLTFPIRQVENLSFLIQIMCWASWILQAQSIGLPSIFLRAQPCSLPPAKLGFLTWVNVLYFSLNWNHEIINISVLFKILSLVRSNLLVSNFTLLWWNFIFSVNMHMLFLAFYLFHKFFMST